MIINLVISEYDRFLAAKKVLDRLHTEYFDSDKTKAALQGLEKGISLMRYRTNEQISPLQEKLEQIQDCVETLKAVKDISMLL